MSEPDSRLAAADFAMFHNLIRDRADHVYRDRKPHAGIGVGRAKEGRIDADELAAEIDQRATRISRIDGCIGLNEVFVLPNSQLVPMQCAYDPGSHRLTDQKRVADGEDEIPNLQLI